MMRHDGVITRSVTQGYDKLSQQQMGHRIESGP